MDHKSDFALARKPQGAVEKAQPGAKRLLSGMVSDALTLARGKQIKLGAKRFLVGDVELREPDYLQLMTWADQLELAPLEVLRRLKAGLGLEGDETKIENGSFIKLHWDPGLLPLSDFRISQKLRLEQLSFTPVENVADLGAKEAGVSLTDDLPPGYDLKARILNISIPALPELKRLDCGRVGLGSLAAGQAASLEFLNCFGNQLQLLDLKPFPNLRRLDCTCNDLTELDLAYAPELLDLDCRTNLIKGLDLSSASKLRRLYCSDNAFCELVLPNLPDLVELECSNSYWDKDAGLGQYLERIDLRGAPKLERLVCEENRLESLDLSGVPKLKYLDCSANLLVELDLADVPLLETLQCGPIHKRWMRGWNPPWITELDIRELSCLKELGCDKRTRLFQRPDQHFQGGDYCWMADMVANDAVKSFRSAASERGDARAQNALGNCYFYGGGVVLDLHEAHSWYTKAAKQGNLQAKENARACLLILCGQIFEDEDSAQAYSCYKSASEKNNEKGMQYLKALMKGMTAAEIAEGELRYHESKQNPEVDEK